MAKPGQRFQKWTNVRTALKTIWSKEKIDSLVQRLGEYRSQLSLRVLTLLNARFETLGENIGKKLSLLQKESSDIVKVLSLNQSSLQSAITDVRQDLQDSHKETMTAILTMGDGSSRVLAGPSCPGNTITSSEAPAAGTSATLWTSDSVITCSSESFNHLTTRIQKSLYFQRISDREFSIHEAHARTFDWVFHERSPISQKCDSLSTWLKSGRGCYWACGKAGSGKSTLFKFILTRRRRDTLQLLRKWAGPSHLIMASFYFWYAGTPLQNSQIGLLRSILHAVLTEKPGLAPILFPSVFGATFSGQAQECIDFSFEELKRAFKTLVSSAPPGLKMCFIIDGLDEYDGDVSELAELFIQAATSESVKILLSSRPVPACVEAFSLCPKLRLQDLTKGDIEKYVDDRLATYPLMKRMAAMEMGATNRLVHEITSKAEGVFLWVILVVKRLIDGLRDYDTLSDLLHKLDELPPGLEKLYHHMLDVMDPGHRRQGSKILQLVLRSTETHDEIPMTLLQLSFAEDENYTKGIEAEPFDLSPDFESWQCEVTEGRMRSRCCGLVEVRHSQASKELSKGDGQDPVDFIHRTVVEFLRIKSVQDHLMSLTVSTDFDVDQALINSSLLEMKAKPPSVCNSESQFTVAYRSMIRLLRYGKHMGEVGKVQLDRYLPSLRHTMSHYWQPRSLSAVLQMSLQGVEESYSRCCQYFELSHSEAIIIYAAIACDQEIVTNLLWCLYPLKDKHVQKLSDCSISGLLIRVRLVTCLVDYFRQSLLATTPNQPFAPLMRIYKCVGGEVKVWCLLLGFARLLTGNATIFDQWVMSRFKIPYLDLIIDMTSSGDYLDHYASMERDQVPHDHFVMIGVGAPGATYRSILSALLSKLWGARASTSELSHHESGLTALAVSDRELAERARKISMLIDPEKENKWEKLQLRGMSKGQIGRIPSLAKRKAFELPHRIKSDSLSKLGGFVVNEDWSDRSKNNATNSSNSWQPSMGTRQVSPLGSVASQPLDRGLQLSQKTSCPYHESSNPRKRVLSSPYSEPPGS